MPITHSQYLGLTNIQNNLEIRINREESLKTKDKDDMLILLDMAHRAIHKRGNGQEAYAIIAAYHEVSDWQKEWREVYKIFVNYSEIPNSSKKNHLYA